jgi:serine/threonine-protein kinase
VQSDRPAGTVVGQNPNGSAPAGSTVTLLVSKAVATVSPVPVPDVVGLSYGAASSLLRVAGFELTREDVESDRPAGTVVAQNPSGSAPAKSTITLSVSKGPGEIPVPDVRPPRSREPGSSLRAKTSTPTRPPESSLRKTRPEARQPARRSR